MKHQPNRNYNSNDLIQTPKYLCEKIVNHFNPEGDCLEPCKGEGNFLYYLPDDSEWCELLEGKDFMEYDDCVNWIITNPPWSKIRDFLKKSMDVSDNVVFLFTINHLWTKARLRDIKEKGFGIREIIIFDTPDNFPPSGFQVGCVHLKRGWSGDIKFTDWRINEVD